MLFPSTDVEIVETEQRKGERERRPASAGDCGLDYTPVTPLQHYSPPTTGPDYHYTE